MNAVSFRKPETTGFTAFAKPLNRRRKPSFSRYSVDTDGFRAAMKRRAS
jgi:hypothetical protein